jgi:hypothetical protein
MRPARGSGTPGWVANDRSGMDAGWILVHDHSGTDVSPGDSFTTNAKIHS